MLATLWLRSVERDNNPFLAEPFAEPRKKESPLWTWERSSKSEEIGRNHLLGLKKNNVSTGLTACVQIEDSSHLHGIVSLGEVDLLLLLLLGDARSILLAQSSADGTGLLCAEVEGKVLLVLVEDAQLRALVDVDDGQDASDGLADVVAVDGKKRIKCQTREFGSEARIRRVVVFRSYILVSLPEEPPVTFWVRSWTSSAFNSSN